MATMIGRSMPVPRRQARWMAICFSGMGSHGTGGPIRRRPPLRGPRRGMSPGPRGWENPGVEQTVETPPPSPAAPDPGVSRLSSSTGRAGDHRPVRLLLVDDHQVVLEGLVSMLASERDRVTILGATTEPAEALRLAADLDPDVVLLDVRLKGASGLDVCPELTRRHERPKVVFYTDSDA